MAKGDMNCSTCGKRHGMCGPKGKNSDMGKGSKYVTHSDPSNDKPPARPVKSKWWA